MATKMKNVSCQNKKCSRQVATSDCKSVPTMHNSV